MSSHNLEQALEEIERAADGVVRAAAAALTEAKRVKAAAVSGQLRALRQSLDTAVRLADMATDAARDLQRRWIFDEQDYFTSGAFAAEVLAVGGERGLSAFESDGRILSYPAIVSVSASDTSVLIDKRKDRKVRPSVLVRTLKALQAKPPKFKPEAYLEALAAAYDFVVAHTRAKLGATVTLADIYTVLTVLPGSARDYSRQELARDLYLLDQSGLTRIKDGRELQLPASALTRTSSVLRTVTRSGQEKVYAGISFVAGRS